METYFGPNYPEQLKTESFKMETPETIRTSLQAGEGVVYLHRFQRYILQHTSTQPVQEVHVFSNPGSVLPIQSTAIQPVHRPWEFTVVVKEVKFLALQKGIRIHQYLDDWLVRARSHQICLQHTQTLVALCQELGWLVNKDKPELEPKQVFNFLGYQFDLI